MPHFALFPRFVPVYPCFKGTDLSKVGIHLFFNYLLIGKYILHKIVANNGTENVNVSSSQDFFT